MATYTTFGDIPLSNADVALDDTAQQWTFSDVLVSGLAQNSVVFVGASGLLSEDTSNFVWDNTNKRLGIRTSSPGGPIDARGDTDGLVRYTLGNVNEGASRRVDVAIGLGATVTETLYIGVNPAGTNHEVYFDNRTGGAIAWQTSGVNKMVLTTAGSLGINTDSPTQKLDVNDVAFRVRQTSTPATAGASGEAGKIAWDTNYIYVCVATNTWKRAALSTW